MVGSRIRNKTVSFSFENGVVWTGSKFSIIEPSSMQNLLQITKNVLVINNKRIFPFGKENVLVLDN